LLPIEEDGKPDAEREEWAGAAIDILHANGVRAYQLRATPWESSLEWHNPPCQGGGSFRGLRPLRAPECSEGPAFPGCYPGRVCRCAFSACSCESGLEARMPKLQCARNGVPEIPARPRERKPPSGIPPGCGTTSSLNRGSRCASTPGYRLSSLRDEPGAAELCPAVSILILIGRRDFNLAEVQGRLQDGAVHTFGQAEGLWRPSSAGLSFEVSDPPLNFLPVDATCLIHIPGIIDSGRGVLKAVGVPPTRLSEGASRCRG
jgi:hypothetical protein